MEFKLLDRIKMKHKIEELNIYNNASGNNNYYGLLHYYNLLYVDIGENIQNGFIDYLVKTGCEEQVKDFLKMRIRCRLNICNLGEQELPQQFEKLLN